MADTSLLLNFTTDLAPSTINLPRFKGGSWRERRRLNRGPKPRTTETSANTELQRPNTAFLSPNKDLQRREAQDFEESRPAKRRRSNDHESVGPNRVLQSSEHRRKPSTQPQNARREIVSSLFTYNPTATTIEEKPNKNEEATQPVNPSNAPLPDGIDTFTSLGLSEGVAAHLLTKMSLKNPTAIQRSAVSQLTRENADVFIQSETGSGKTLAYLLPIVQRLVIMAERHKHEMGLDKALQRNSGLFAIILAPTRELCKQIFVVLEKLLGCAHYIVAGHVIGGEKKKSEKARLRKGLNILVATPGRLLDHLENTQSLDVSNVRFLVLDEGDRLMDLGFEEDISKIVRNLDDKNRKSDQPGLPDRRITILCSATLRANVERLGDLSLKDAVLVKGDGEDEKGQEQTASRDNSIFLAPAQLKQSYTIAAAKLRLVTLSALLRRTFARKGSVMKAIVFITCADSVDFHFRAFTRNQYMDETSIPNPAEAVEQPNSTALASEAIALSPMLSSSDNPLTCYKLHGSLPQQTRTSIVKAFAAASTASVLIATDVASRGLDLPNLDLVIEYDPAFSKEDHLHRIGRTARLGKDGRALIFLMPGPEEAYVEVLKESYKTDTGFSNVSFTSSEELLKKGFSPSTGVVSSGKDWENKATEFQLDVERWILSDAKNKELAKNAFQSHIRAYATHTAAERQYFDIKDLHLGHLAKSFGLRDAPGKVNVVGLGRQNGTSTNKANAGRRNQTVSNVTANSDPKADVEATRNSDEAALRMKQLIRNKKKMMGAGADEFNIA